MSQFTIEYFKLYEQLRAADTYSRNLSRVVGELESIHPSRVVQLVWRTSQWSRLETAIYNISFTEKWKNGEVQYPTRGRRNEQFIHDLIPDHYGDGIETLKDMCRSSYRYSGENGACYEERIHRQLCDRLYGVWKMTVDLENDLQLYFEDFGTDKWVGDQGGRSLKELEELTKNPPSSVGPDFVDYKLQQEMAGLGSEVSEGGEDESSLTPDEYKSDFSDLWDAAESLTGGSHGSGLSSGHSWGGGSDLDWGGGSGSDWSGGGWEDSWTSSLLNDTVDTVELAAAAEDLHGAIQKAQSAVSTVGMTALSGMTDALSIRECTILEQYGDALVDMARRYGLQAGLALGGVAALYATKEQTTEVVARTAEFFSTKCGPAVADVMDQVGGVAAKTRVSLENAKSNMVAAVHGEKVGDLLA